MLKIPSMSSRQLSSLLERGWAVLARQRKTDHAIYSRIVEGRRFSAPLQMGKKTLDPIYCKRLLGQLKFSDEKIQQLLV